MTCRPAVVAVRGVATTKIAPLAGDVIDQIAAGEVVERPASVVKELVENAVDAGATQVAVDIAGGGLELIRVADDGHGMSAADAELAMVRHATSKLRGIDDLDGLRTFGFRGEALAAVGSVSRLQLTTRERGGSNAAFRLSSDAGRIVSREQVGGPEGTEVTVSNLFYNVPARRKFLKSPTTEVAHMVEVVTQQALAHPHIHFRMTNGGKVSFTAPPHRDWQQRVESVLRAKLAAEPAQGSAQVAGVSVRVLVGAASDAQSLSRATRLFVGRRPVRDRGLLHAVTSAHGDQLPSGRYPVAAVFVDVDGAKVDVNVHPQKLEVRFSDPQAVYAAVRYTVRQALEEANHRDVHNSHAFDGSKVDIINPGASGLARSSAAALERRRRWRSGRASGGATPEWGAGLSAVATERPMNQRSVATGSAISGTPTHKTIDDRVAEGSGPWRSSSSTSSLSLSRCTGEIPLLRYRATLSDDLWICEADEALWVVSGKVACERVMAGQLIEGVLRAAQKFLVPVSVAVDGGVRPDLLKALADMGVVGRAVEGASVIEVLEGPMTLSEADHRDIVLHMHRALGAASPGGSSGSLDAKQVAASAIARRIVRREGVPQTAPEIAATLEALRGQRADEVATVSAPLAVGMATAALRGMFARA